MPTFSPQQLQATTGGTWAGGRVLEGRVHGFTQDSRLLQPGMCFVALQTAVRDGHDFLPAALNAGAAMALVAREVAGCPLPQLVVTDPLRAFQQIARAHRLSFGGKVIGVTGSCGKTSTKNILQTLLGESCYATAGNLNNFIGVPLTLLGLEAGAVAAEVVERASAKKNCPTAAETGETLLVANGSAGAESATPAPRFAVIEAGISEQGEMAVLADMIRPDIAVVTMVGPAHLEDLGSVEGVATEKAVLATAQGEGGRSVVAQSEGSGSVVAQGGENVAVSQTPLRQTPLRQTPLLFAPLECWRYPAFAALQNKGAAVAPFAAGDLSLSHALPPGIALHRYRVEVGQGAAEYDRSIEAAGTAEGGHGIEAAGTAERGRGIGAEGEMDYDRSTEAVGGTGYRRGIEAVDGMDHGRGIKAESGAEQAVLVLEGERLSGRFPLSFVPSAGMASNFALALLAAQAAGCPQALLAQRAAGWRPQGNRGSWLATAGRLFFVDCYNANPASMADALDYFTNSLDAGASATKARLFVIGGMRELGAQSAQWHRQLGERLGALAQPPRGDRVVLIGAEPDNAACLAGIRSHAPQLPVECFATTAEARPALEAFCGVVFLKGSRSYALEALLPSAADG